MAYDLLFDAILKRPNIIKKSWARCDRGPSPVIPPSPPVAKIAYTPEEKTRLDKLASLRMRAESGDKKARREWRRVLSQVKTLRKRARRGDARASRALLVLSSSGVVGDSQKIAVSGDDVKSTAAILDSARRGDKQAQQHFAKLFASAKEGNPSQALKQNADTTDIHLARQVLEEEASKGNVSAQIKLRKMKIRDAVKREQREGPDLGSSEIMEEFVGDEERLSRDAGPAERTASARICGEYPSRRGRSRNRGRRLRVLAWKSSRGDAAATAKLQQITTRLQQRASAGDTRAANLLSQIQTAQTQAQSQVTSQPAAAASAYAYPPTGSPPAAPAPVTYTAPAQDFTEDDY